MAVFDLQPSANLVIILRRYTPEALRNFHLFVPSAGDLTLKPLSNTAVSTGGYSAIRPIVKRQNSTIRALNVTADRIK
jgi:hypothetical protein